MAELERRTAELAALHDLRVEASYLYARYRRHANLSPHLVGLRDALRSLSVSLDLDARVTVEGIRLDGLSGVTALDGSALAPPPETEARARLELRIEARRVDARLARDRRAVRDAIELLATYLKAFGMPPPAPVPLRSDARGDRALETGSQRPRG